MNENGDLQRNYYSVIPANVRYDETLVANAKLMYGEITALSNQKGFCYASNAYFAQLYKVTPQAISKWINQLAEKGYIHINYQKQGNLIVERRIYIEMPKQNKRQPLLERNPKNDLEKVEKLYLQNYTSLFKQGIVKMDKPVINWTASRKLTKDCIEKYGVETVLDAVRKSLSNKFVVSNGYVLTTILSAGVLSQLINSTNGRIDNDVVEEEITF